MAAWPTGTGRPGIVTVPHPRPRAKLDLAVGRGDARPDQSAMGDIGVIAGILDDPGFGPPVAGTAAGQRK